MAFVKYTPSSKAWNNIENETYGQKFYPLQEGKGSSIQLVSPAQGSIQRAKSDLKRQLSESRCQTASGSPKKRKRKNPPSKKKKRKPVTKKTKKKVASKKRKKKPVKSKK